MPEHVMRGALNVSLYVIDQAGDTVRIEEPWRIRGW
jgi:hypothetical protein